MNKLKLHLLAWVAVGLVSAADAQTSSTNSVVRFRLSYGSTFFGDVDVEMFDKDKPLTVSNFLANVQSGTYENTIVHDLRPGFLMQGGSVAVPNPYSTGPFELITRVSTGAPIPNEVGAGTRRPNAFGTLAMAKSPGTTNSSTAAWFFNMGNNADGYGVTNLDAIDGGYTVFGRVKAGGNVLTYMNTFTPGNGLQNMTNDFHIDFCPPLYLFPDNVNLGFDSIPVGYFGTDCIRFNDTFNVQLIMLNGPDVAPPKLTITFPAPVPADAGGVRITGTATDNVAVESVRVYLGTNAPVTALGTNAWSVLLANVPPGTNQVVVEAIDTTGNRAQVSRTFFRSVPAPFGLTVIGNGTVTGPTNGALLELTRGYTLVAKPAAGWLFAGWTGSITQPAATLPFLMESNLHLTALFMTNPFPAVKGNYNALVHNDTAVEQRSSGSLSLTLGNLGAYSAKLLLDGRTHRFSGHLSLTGGETNLIARAKTTNYLLIRLAVDLAGSGHVTGSLTNNQIVFIDTNAGWSASIVGDRAVFSKANPAPLAGKYTAVIPADTTTTGPDGEGSASVTVAPNGMVSFLGTLADGTKVARKAPVSAAGNYPLYVSLYKGKGALLSWVTFDKTQPTTDLSGVVSWIKQAQTAQFYSGGFSNQVTMLGSGYSAPAVGAKVLPLTIASVCFTNGNLAANFANDVMLETDNKIVNNSANDLNMKISLANGLFTGNVTPPGGVSRPFRGAILQKQGVGAGSLSGTDKTSHVMFH